MRSVLTIILLLVHPIASAMVVSATPQMSSECDAYLKKIQQNPSKKVNSRPNGFPVEAYPSAPSKPKESKTSRALILAKDAPKSEQPFWRVKPGLMEKMERERQVLTSVTKSNLPNGEVKFDMKVGGIVNASRGFVFKTAQNYGRLPEVADAFKYVHFEPNENRLYLILSALGYQERMVLELYPVSGDGRDELQFEVVWGNFKGMKGFIGFESFEITKTEMSLIASYQSKTLPLPKILMGFALEVVTQKVAEKLRAFMEADYKQALKCGVL